MFFSLPASFIDMVEMYFLPTLILQMCMVRAKLILIDHSPESPVDIEYHPVQLG